MLVGPDSTDGPWSNSSLLAASTARPALAHRGSAHQRRSRLRFARVPWVPIVANPERGTQEHDFKNVGKGRPLLLVSSLLSSSCLSGPSGKRNHLSCMISCPEEAGR